jgi:hypothetical protein
LSAAPSSDPLSGDKRDHQTKATGPDFDQERSEGCVLVDRILEGSERNHLTDLGEQHGFLVEI